jgi:tetratricopeptide (TPR) repeat protein
MLKKTLLFFLVFIMISSSWVLIGHTANEMATDISDEAYYNQQGLSHFKRGVYELSPQQRKKEAAQEYRLAIQAFKKALSINPDNAEALRNLARVHAVQKDFLLAAELYVKLTVLDPYALDAYMYAASAFERAQRYDDARAQIETARSKTSDPEIIEKLNGYLEEIERRAQQGE